ncbi:MAG: hypothetical protein V4523_12940 [Pseudomonadota bacterium]
MSGLVRAPIHYGRKSVKRGGTFTMTFRQEEPSGFARLVPCKRDVESIDDLVEEASALWKAEAPNSKIGEIAARWGSVGVLFGNANARTLLASDWSDHFRGADGRALSVVTADGEFDIQWPNYLDGKPIELDILLATATNPETSQPAVESVAEAWMKQDDGYERYFLQNVRHGIRTADDLKIWRHMASNPPAWMSAADSYAEVFDALRKEAQDIAAS